MIRSESIVFEPSKLTALRKLVSQGEGHHLEFKRKAAFPEKIVRELIAFANTDGGILLIGVDDDKSIPGLRYPEEESLVVRQEIEKHSRPVLAFEEEIIAISEKKFVLQWRIGKSEKRPHFYVGNGQRNAFIRQKDQSIKTSGVMNEVLRRQRSKSGARFTYGEAEQKIIHFLADHESIGLQELAKVAGLNKFMTSRKIVKLVLANVLRITATEKGDVFSRA
jgi:predicted HTH transcriptional regulator